MIGEIIPQGFIAMGIGKKHLNGTSGSGRRGGHSTGSLARGIASNVWGLAAVSLFPAYHTPVGK
jgi:hypothetical protein